MGFLKLGEERRLAGEGVRARFPGESHGASGTGRISAGDHERANDSLRRCCGDRKAGPERTLSHLRMTCNAGRPRHRVAGGPAELAERRLGVGIDHGG